MRRLALVGFALLVALSGCGGSGINKEELARSVAHAAEQGLAHNWAVLERRVPNLGKVIPDTGPGTLSPYRIHVMGPYSCLDARSGAPSPQDTAAKYSCFYTQAESGAPRSERIFIEANVYSVSGDCWKAVVVKSEFGVGTMAFEETNFPQKELDNPKYAMHGCIGEEPPQTSSQKPQDQPPEESAQPAPASTAKVCAENFNSVANNRALGGVFAHDASLAGRPAPAWIDLSPDGVCVAVITNGETNVVLKEATREYPGAPPHSFFTAPGYEHGGPIPPFAHPQNAVATGEGRIMLFEEAPRDVQEQEEEHLAF